MRAVLAIAACLAVLAAHPASSLRDSTAPRVQASQSARRIISLVPSVTEMLFAIGAGDAVVGVSSFDRYPPEARRRTKVGGLLDPDFERILSLRPDLVVVYGTQSSLVDRLSRAGIPMFNYQHAGLADITRTLREIGDRVNRGAAASALAASIERRIAGIRSRTAARPKPRTMIVFEREPGSLRGMYGSGGFGFLHDMVEAAGGVNVFADLPRQSVQITAELALSRAPDAIVEVRSGPQWTASRTARERDAWRTLPSLPAVRTGRIYILADEMMSIPGPRVADAIEAIARRLHPEAFR